MDIDGRFHRKTWDVWGREKQAWLNFDASSWPEAILAAYEYLYPLEKGISLPIDTIHKILDAPKGDEFGDIHQAFRDLKKWSEDQTIEIMDRLEKLEFLREA